MWRWPASWVAIGLCGLVIIWALPNAASADNMAGQAADNMAGEAADNMAGQAADNMAGEAADNMAGGAAENTAAAIGDVDCDSSIDRDDVVALLAELVAETTACDPDLHPADIDRDGVVDLDDALQLVQCTARERGCPLADFGPDKLTYLGAFGLPEGAAGESSFSYGGRAAAYRPPGDVEGPGEGLAGSLFISGHPYEQLVAEVTIPFPMPHGGDPSGLARAEWIQPFADIADGRLDLGSDVDQFQVTGLHVVDDGASQHLLWSMWPFYSVGGQRHSGHGRSSVNLAEPASEGPWFLGGFHNQMTAGYQFAAPKPFAAEHFGGRNIIAGFGGWPALDVSSWGPPLFAYAPPGHPGPEPDTELDAIALAYYPHQTNQLPDYLAPDLWAGASWLIAGDTHAVVIAGTEAASDRYGDAQPGDCNPYYGWHGDPYEPQMLFYDPLDLAEVAAGQTEPWQVRPYAHQNLSEYLFDTCDQAISALAFDAARGLLYMVQPGADPGESGQAALPVVHVLAVG